MQDRDASSAHDRERPDEVSECSHSKAEALSETLERIKLIAAGLGGAASFAELVRALFSR